VLRTVSNLRTVSTIAPAARLRAESNMLMPGHLRYGDLEEAAGAADWIATVVLLRVTVEHGIGREIEFRNERLMTRGGRQIMEVLSNAIRIVPGDH
jgi:hypothetical protein